MKYLLPTLRIAIGALLVFSGFQKLIHPQQNFLFIIQAYELGTPWIEETASYLIPWLEFLVGLFLLLGLYTKVAIQGSILLFASFLIVIGQAIVRKLPIDECGCFGELLSVPPTTIFLFDFSILIFLFLLHQKKDAQAFSLDAFFEK